MKINPLPLLQRSSLQRLRESVLREASHPAFTPEQRAVATAAIQGESSRERLQRWGDNLRGRSEQWEDEQLAQEAAAGFPELVYPY
jgi:hypothetical protein